MYKAFTIIEMLVVLLLSTIVIGVASVGWLYFERLNNKININQIDFAKYNRINYLLQLDINNAELINGNTEEINFYYAKETINYKLHDSTIVRLQNELADTFHIQYKIQIVKVENSKDLIHTLDIKFNLYNNTIQKKYTKWYDNSTLLKHTNLP